MGAPTTCRHVLPEASCTGRTYLSPTDLNRLYAKKDARCGRPFSVVDPSFAIRRRRGPGVLCGIVSVFIFAGRLPELASCVPRSSQGEQGEAAVDGNGFTTWRGSVGDRTWTISRLLPPV